MELIFFRLIYQAILRITNYIDLNLKVKKREFYEFPFEVSSIPIAIGRTAVAKNKKREFYEFPFEVSSRFELL